MSSNNLSVEDLSGDVVSLSRRAVRGGMWSAASVLINNISFLLTLWVLARLLTPEDYGLVGILISFTLMVNNISELGLGAAVIQKADLTPVHSSTVFWSNIVMGVGLCLISILIAPLVGAFFRTPRIVTALSITSVSFILHSPGVIHRSLLSRSLAFRQVAIPEILSAGSLMVVSCALAMLGAGVYSIVGGVLFRTLFYSTLLWKVSRWRPQLVWDYSHFIEMFRFGSWVVAASIVNNFNTNIDFLVVGRVHGAAALGFYTLAYQLVKYPRAAIQPLIVRVAFPTFSAVQQDDSTLRRMYCKMVSTTALIMFPFMSLLMAVAPNFIRVVYGQKWTPTILPLQILCIGGALLHIVGTWIAVYQAKGRSDVSIKQNLITAVALSLFVVIGSHFGVVGVAMAISIYACVFFPLFFQVWINRLIGLSFIDLLKSLFPAAMGSAIGATSAFVVRFFAATVWSLSDIFTLLLASLCGCVSYLSYLLLFHRKDIFGLVRMLQSAFPSRLVQFDTGRVKPL